MSVFVFTNNFVESSQIIVNVKRFGARALEAMDCPFITCSCICVKATVRMCMKTHRILSTLVAT